MKKTLLSFNEQKAADVIRDFLKKEFREREKTSAVLGISGGLDSATAAFLCRKAGLDLYLIYLPCGNFSKKEKVVKIAAVLNLPKNRFFEIDIAPFVNAEAKAMEKKIELDKIAVGNIMTRIRMNVLYAFAGKLNGLVVGTGNLSEYLLGYFTRYGDEACDIAPIRGLFKTQIYKLAEFLKVPADIIEQIPSAELWEGQTDEGELGFRYEEADPILEFACVKKYSKEKIMNYFAPSSRGGGEVSLRASSFGRSIRNICSEINLTRVSYNGITRLFQSRDRGSTPLTRSRIKLSSFWPTIAAIDKLAKALNVSVD